MFASSSEPVDNVYVYRHNKKIASMTMIMMLTRSSCCSQCWVVIAMTNANANANAVLGVGRTRTLSWLVCDMVGYGLRK
jgi:hypothetical protein